METSSTTSGITYDMSIGSGSGSGSDWALSRKQLKQFTLKIEIRGKFLYVFYNFNYLLTARLYSV